MRRAKRAWAVTRSEASWSVRACAPESCYITGVGNEPRLPVLYSPSKMTSPLPFPKAAGNYYFPPTNMINADWINIALCAAKRGGENVLDMQRWTREYDGYMSILKGKVTR